MTEQVIQNSTINNPRILIAIPCMQKVDTDFMRSMLDLRKTGLTSYATYTSSMIYDSRNNFAYNAINKGFDRVLWLDSDMEFDADTLVRLNADMDEGYDLVAALAFTRQYPVRPVIYREIMYDPEHVSAKAEPYMNYPADSVFGIAGCGFGCVMTSTNLLKRIWDKYGPPFIPLIQMGEDISFCYRAGLINARMACDSRVKVGHIGTVTFNERVFLAQPDVMQMRGGSQRDTGDDGGNQNGDGMVMPHQNDQQNNVPNQNAHQNSNQKTHQNSEVMSVSNQNSNQSSEVMTDP